MVNSRLLNKLFMKRWVIGIANGDIKEIIRTRKFDQNINWLPFKSKSEFIADPFILESGNGITSIMFEHFSIEDNYGNISLMILDKNLNETRRNVLLDTKSHLSFPFIFRDKGKIYVIPESVRSGKLSIYEYDNLSESLRFQSHLLPNALYDPVIIYRNGRYWLLGSTFEGRIEYRMHVYYSDKLTGPYTSHPGNPVKTGLDGVRAAGNIIEVDNVLYRPSQNCANGYGESITINKILSLDEKDYAEEAYMLIEAGKEMIKNKIYRIHTLNVSGNLIVVDGMKWILSVVEQWKSYRNNRKQKNADSDAELR